ncbi:adenine deaminase C-terminal domain-containing protein [Bacillus sp. CGMCC 1.16541]|uniref:adenine deaminase C-terminal domain-containing protein n=1 Tax=Bacillus sp. CGMCC 1.16541 TaxID=2185143 RepID=UPI000D7377FC|nr:adenine deaminase C-terminal domain-containing protein [Bacillus sp. CGMCC 1.16541]
MPEQRYRWKNRQIREQIEILNGQKSPTTVLTNATYLNSYRKAWMNANIWIAEDRIVYVGDAMPELLDEKADVIDCHNQFLVPGYIEPHVHPFQLYNPHTFAQYASEHGTTTLINDNMVLALQPEKKKAFSFLESMKSIPSTMYWWSRFDAQTEIINEEAVFSHRNVTSWIEHDAVLQGGELTGWPKLIDGDDLMLHWIQETKRMGKKIEGHFPGASEMTLAKMLLFGADCDHESMSGEDALRRLSQGYTVSLRYSSIRPDLPSILKELKELGIEHYDRFMMTTDGSPPSFYKEGVSDMLIKIAMDQGVTPIDAYHMASHTIAKYYNMEHLHGSIAPGRIANINFLKAIDHPTPQSVLAKGKWVLKSGEKQVHAAESFPWTTHGFAPLRLEWDLKIDDLQFSMALGMKMMNSVIMKPYSVNLDVSVDELSDTHDESFLVLMDRHGKWRVNTILKGFTNGVSGFASSYSNTGDIILIGKKKEDMMAAFNRMKALGGGIVLVENNEVVYEVPMLLNGIMSEKPLEELMEEELTLTSLLRERGYKHNDPIYSLLFFSSTHLPYVRITPRGIYDVMNKKVLFPSIMR